MRKKRRKVSVYTCTQLYYRKTKETDKEREKESNKKVEFTIFQLRLGSITVFKLSYLSRTIFELKTNREH